MEDPVQKEKTKTLKIKTRHCLLHRLISQDKSIEVKDMGGGDRSAENPTGETKPYIDLVVQLNIHDDISDVFAFEGDVENPQKCLRAKKLNALLQVAKIDGKNRMTALTLEPRSLLVAVPLEKKADWFSFPEGASGTVVENKAKNWQWANIAQCDECK